MHVYILVLDVCMYVCKACDLLFLAFDGSVLLYIMHFSLNTAIWCTSTKYPLLVYVRNCRKAYIVISVIVLETSRTDQFCRQFQFKIKLSLSLKISKSQFKVSAVGKNSWTGFKLSKQMQAKGDKQSSQTNLYIHIYYMPTNWGHLPFW